MSDEESIGVKVDGEFKREVRIAAAEENMNMSAFVRKVLRSELEGGEGNPSAMASS